MSLSEQERKLIARRATGDYGVMTTVRKIVESHKKNRNPDDSVFLQFARLVTRRSWSEEEYQRLQRAVLEIMPDPWDLPKSNLGKAEPKKRTVTCRLCGEIGHNARSCSRKPESPTSDYADGVERLTPGFDPNPVSGQ